MRPHLARSSVGIGHHPGAIREYEDLMQALPENVVVLNNLAFLYQTEGDDRATPGQPLRVVSSAGAAALDMAAAACETKPCLYDIPIDSSQEP